VEGSDLGTKGATKTDCADCSGEGCTGEGCTGEGCTGEGCTGEGCTGEGCTGDLAGATWLGREKLELLAPGYQAGALGLSLLGILTVGGRVS
jgi:hypothetical protein